MSDDNITFCKDDEEKQQVSLHPMSMLEQVPPTPSLAEDGMIVSATDPQTEENEQRLLSPFREHQLSAPTRPASATDLQGKETVNCETTPDEQPSSPTRPASAPAPQLEENEQPLQLSVNCETTLNEQPSSPTRSASAPELQLEENEQPLLQLSVNCETTLNEQPSSPTRPARSAPSPQLEENEQPLQLSVNCETTLLNKQPSSPTRSASAPEHQLEENEQPLQLSVNCATMQSEQPSSPTRAAPATTPQLEEDEQRRHLSVDCVTTLNEQTPQTPLSPRSSSKIEMKLSKDTFSLMMIKKPMSLTWVLAITIAAIQITSLILIFADQVGVSKASTVFDIPFRVSWQVRVGQVLALFINIAKSNDVIVPIKDITLLCYKRDTHWFYVVNRSSDPHAYPYQQVPLEEENMHSPTKTDWHLQILLPNCIKLLVGVFVMIVTHVIIIQSEELIPLYEEFAALYLIAEVDNYGFFLAENGYFGISLQEDTKEVEKITIKDLTKKDYEESPCCFGRYFRPMILIFLGGGLLVWFIIVAQMQDSGQAFYSKHPNCAISTEKIRNFKNGVCDGGVLNTFQCEFDGGDCVYFNQAFPNCETFTPDKVGNGVCDIEFNNEDCGFDGGDCCGVDEKNDPYLGDNYCHAGHYNSKGCEFDNGDCETFQKKYPKCDHQILDNVLKDDGSPVVIGDDICDFISQSYMTLECGYEFGDCNDCKVVDPSLLFNGVCDGGQYNMEGCRFDLGDCNECNSLVKNASLIGNGFCNGGAYMVEQCNNDGGDCEGCKAPDPWKLGDGHCDHNSIYNTKACGWDGGDCIESNNDFTSRYPNCNWKPYGGIIGDGHCNGILNNEECGEDAGDCECFNAKNLDDDFRCP